MSYSNSTPNYELPQYDANDKPTYLGDFNQAMLKIDTTMKNNHTLAQNANEKAEQANSLSTQNTTDIESLETSVSNAQTTANNAQTTANNTQQSLNALKNGWHQVSLKNTEGATITCNFNNDLSLIGFYGSFYRDNQQIPSGTYVLGTLPNTFNKPSQQRHLINVGTSTFTNTQYSQSCNLVIETNGDVKLFLPGGTTYSQVNIQCLCVTYNW